MKRWMLMAALLLIGGGVALIAEDKITVEANNDDISEGLDLKAVATLFGNIKDLKEFETKLNSDSLHLSNLDLNGDGIVDYLRVVEVEEKTNKHLVIIQAVLAKDVYQDIATIYVEKKDKADVFVQMIGDTHIYSQGYIIEPVYLYRPPIYDWFWGPNWYCYNSPWYWGYWPGWYAPYPCWGYRDYWVHIHVYHYDHPICSYRYGKEVNTNVTSMQNYNKRSDYADANATRSFTARTGKNNARELNTSARTATTSRATTSNSRTVSSTSRATATTGRSYSMSAPSHYTSTGSSSNSALRGSAYSSNNSSSYTTYSSSSSNRMSSSASSSSRMSSSGSSGSRMSSSAASVGHSSSGGGYSSSYGGATRR